jgi:RNA polymerase sigma factor (sigma-70 family)
VKGSCLSIKAMNFEELWTRYYRDLVADLTHVVDRREDAEELASDALNATWRRIESIQPGARWTYLRTAARRGAINHHRNANAQRRDARQTGSLDEWRDDADLRTPEKLAIVREARASILAGVRAVMEELPPETKVYIAARHRGLSLHQIANEFGASVSAVQSRLYRATQRFEERLGPAPKGIPWIEIVGELDDHEG